MNAYIVHHSLTLGTHDVAARFYELVHNELSQHISVSGISSFEVCGMVKPAKEDALILFNRPDQNYQPPLASLLNHTFDLKAQIFPIAVSIETRSPLSILKMIQSYDFTDELRRRSLTDSQLPTIASAFSRAILARLQPTLAKERMQFFISYRRVDGEDLAGRICADLRIRAASVFRDLVDIQIGEDAQEVIEERLQKSDAVIFLDTPSAGSSDWVARELELALSLGIPIVWIKIGADEGRDNLRVMPAKKPHFEMTDKGFADPTIADQFIKAASDQARSAVPRVFDHINRITEIVKAGNGKLILIDRNNLLYELQVPRKGYRYPQRPLTHLLQFYGRRPGAQDETYFDKCADSYRASLPGQRFASDVSLLLAPIPAQAILQEDGKTLYVDSMEEYTDTLERLVEPPQQKVERRGVIISGSFPNSEPEKQQLMTDAVHSLVRAILLRQGKVIFGGHPTFTPLIFELSKRLRPTDFREAVHLYFSRRFADDIKFNKYRKNSTVFPTDNVNGDYAKSLTLMRKTMMSDPEATALVAIGGRTEIGGRILGVDEEIKFAREAGLKVFLIGSAGGRSAEIGSQFHSRDWADSPNKLTVQENQQLFLSEDYGQLARLILRHVGL